MTFSSFCRLARKNSIFNSKGWRLPRRYLSSIGDQQKVGFIGLGNMGLPMAINLATKMKETTSVISFDLNSEAMKVATNAGIQQASSLEELAKSNCSTIFTMLPGCDAVNTVMPILLENSKDNTGIVFVDSSTVSLDCVFVLGPICYFIFHFSCPCLI